MKRNLKDRKYEEQRPPGGENVSFLGMNGKNKRSDSISPAVAIKV